MIPGDLMAFTQGWNRAQGGDATDPPTAEEYADLVRRYG